MLRFEIPVGADERTRRAVMLARRADVAAGAGYGLFFMDHGASGPRRWVSWSRPGMNLLASAAARTRYPKPRLPR